MGGHPPEGVKGFCLYLVAAPAHLDPDLDLKPSIWTSSWTPNLVSIYIYYLSAELCSADGLLPQPHGSTGPLDFVLDMQEDVVLRTTWRERETGYPPTLVASPRSWPVRAL